MEIYNDRINILKKKISLLSNSNNINNKKDSKQKFEKENNYEMKFNELKSKYEEAIQTLEMKYKILKEHSNKLIQILEDNNMKDEKTTSKIIESIDSIETKIRNQLNEEEVNLENKISKNISNIKESIIALKKIMIIFIKKEKKIF